MNRGDKINEAAEFLGAQWCDGECVYRDDSTNQYYVCSSAEEMLDLYDLMHDEDPEISRDAYSHWCAWYQHPELTDPELTA